MDTTGPAYKYQDDPFLTPYSRLDKKKYALSKESGIKAARYIRDNYSELFNYHAAEPEIKV